MGAIRNSFVSGLAFLAGYLLPALAALLWAGVQQQAGRGGASADGMSMALYLVIVQSVIGALVYAVLTGLSRRWRLRSASTRVTVSLIAGLAGYLASWTGLFALGLIARGMGDGMLAGGAGTAGWVLAAWPGFAAGLVVLIGSLIIAPPEEPARVRGGPL